MWYYFICLYYLKMYCCSQSKVNKVFNGYHSIYGVFISTNLKRCKATWSYEYIALIKKKWNPRNQTLYFKMIIIFKLNCTSLPCLRNCDPNLKISCYNTKSFLYYWFLKRELICSIVANKMEELIDTNESSL